MNFMSMNDHRNQVLCSCDHRENVTYVLRENELIYSMQCFPKPKNKCVFIWTREDRQSEQDNEAEIPPL